MLNIGIIGNPNSGKTTLYNYLTKNNQKVGNWPGVTVEYKTGTYFKDDNITFIDLPGIYSMSPYTAEEVVSREYLINSKPDVIINIVDATNLERSLYLSAQLTKVNIPMVIALNMYDILKDDIDIEHLSQAFHVPVIPISALEQDNIEELVNSAKTQKSLPKQLDLYHHDINDALNTIIKTINIPDQDHVDWYALKLLENDSKVVEDFNLSDEHNDLLKSLRKDIEHKFNDDISGVIINQTYNFITKLRNDILIKHNTEESFSSKIDKVVTHKYLAFPILAVVMFLLYYLTVSSIGGFITDFIEEVFFPEYIILPVQTFLANQNVSLILQSLIVDGFIAGVGVVVTFVPQIMILFFLISILEDVGYMTRIAFVLDKVFTRFGMSGTSVIPMIIGSGCSVPAILSTKTIKEDSNRRLTIILTPFVICSAKLPIFVLLIGIFFPKSPWILVALYFLGIVMILLSGLFLKQFKAFKSDDSTFIMEMVDYKKPNLKSSLRSSLDNGIAFVKNAGTIIFVASGFIWFLTTFNFRLQITGIENSMLASIGNVVAPLFIPLGFGSWQATVATLTGFFAKETVVTTFSILASSSGTHLTLAEYMPTIVSQAGALSMMVFTVFAAPCFAAIAATKRELGTWKWTFITVGYQTSVAYILAFIVYNIANIIL